MARGSARLATANADGSVSLRVCTDAKKKTVRPSKSGKRRAIVLIGVHVLIAAHIGLWLAMGRTMSPVEPSESMQTLETGLVNAGFVFFALALLSTAIFGRFFCGWACHVVALQDLCRWMMLKVGIHPKPFRARLLAFVPLGLALYMFVWPNFKRFVVFPAIEAAGGAAPVWLKPVPMPMGFEAHFIVEDFWATFPTWFIAIPFFLVVGFAAVYFLGAKGFCFYGCPYGGFFTPIDRISPVRIRVTDACEGCGHCTAVCSSNVRVHEEVRDFGMVVDPGCMKCLDCVSVCPNDALFVGFGAPAIFAKPRTEAAKETAKAARARRKRTLDASWGEEIVIIAAFALMFFGFRGMLDAVPMLMAVGMAGVGAYGVWMVIRLVRDRNARLHRTQLKRDGRVNPAGWAFIAATVLVVAAAAWGTAVRYERWRADLLYAQVKVPSGLALTPGFTPAASDRERAEKALAHYARADGFGRGGFGWRLSPDELLRVAYLQVVRGDLESADAAMAEIIAEGNPTAGLVFERAEVMRARGADETEVAAVLGDALERHEELHGLRREIALRASSADGFAVAESVWDRTPEEVRDEPQFWVERTRYWIALGSAERAKAALDTAAVHLETGRRDAAMWVELAEIALTLQEPETARAFVAHAKEHELHDPAYSLRVAGILLQIGETAEGRVWLGRGTEHPRTPMNALLTAAQMHAQLGEVERTVALTGRAADAAGDEPWELVQVGGTLVSIGRGLGRPEVVERGVGLVERASELKPESSALAERLALLYANLERYGEAAAAMARAAELAPTSVLLAERAAELYEHADDAERGAYWRGQAERRRPVSP